MPRALKSFPNHNLCVFWQNWHCHEEHNSLVLSFSFSARNLRSSRTVSIPWLIAVKAPALLDLGFLTVFSSLVVLDPKLDLIHLPSKQGQGEGKGKMHLLCLRVSVWLTFFFFL